MCAGVLTRTDVLGAVRDDSGVRRMDRAFRAASARRGSARGGTSPGRSRATRPSVCGYYGDALPNTYYLKVWGAPLLARVERGAATLLIVAVLHLLVPLAITIAAAVRSGRAMLRTRRGEVLLAALFLAACAYSVYVGGDAWESMFYANRYITPAVPGLLVLTALALDDLLRAPAPTRAATGGALFVIAALLTVVTPVVTQELTATTADQRLRLVRAAIVAAPVLILPVVARARRAAAVVLTAACIVAVNGLALALWGTHNAFYVDDDAWAARYGLALRAATPDDAAIAVTWAGAIPYFSHRTTVDLLGKSDRVVARLPRQAAAGFDPGHDKWDYAYSIGRFRPDVVAQLWHATDAERSTIEQNGYAPLGPWTFVRGDAAVNRDAIRGVACEILREDPFVVGSPTRAAVESAGFVARYCRE